MKKVDCQQVQGRLKTKYKLQLRVHQYPSPVLSHKMWERRRGGVGGPVQ